MSSHGPSMDIKVLYTLDSSPNHTMVARLGRQVPVEVIIPNMTPPSPLEPSSSNYHQSSPPRQVRFGRITLKACLGAVCMASPELLPDDKRDYIIYAVDPEETMRAQQLRSPSSRGQATPTHSSSSASSRNRNDASSSKLSSSPLRPKDTPTSILVGKGFFNWALDEQGDGETTVTGRVRSDGRRLRYENGREYEEDVNVLEVVIKLKESQARSKDKYFNLVRGLSSGSSFSAGSSAASGSSSTGRSSSRLPLRDEATVAAHRFRSSRHIEHDQPLSLHSEPDYPTSTSSYGTVDRQIRRPAARPSSRSTPIVDKATERIFSPKAAHLQLGASPSLPTLSSFSASASSPAASPNAAALSAAAAPNASTIQLLTILHSLQQRSSKSAPEPAQQAQLESLLQQVAQTLGNTSASSPATDSVSLAEPSATAPSRASISPALSARPLDSISVPNSRSPVPPAESSHPGKENRLTAAASKDSPQTGVSRSRRQSTTSPSFEDEDASSPSLQRKDAHDTSSRICYNCGTDVPTTWRILKLPAGSVVNNPSAEKGSGSDGSNDDSNEPGWKPRYAGNDSPIQTDDETKWSACNPCGLYYLKWNNSRPEYVWRKEHATKAYRERKALAEAAKRQRDNKEAGPNKRSKIANPDVDAVSPYTRTTPREGDSSKDWSAEGGASDESMTSPYFDGATPGSSSGRKSSMPRTLSEACHRDAEKLESQRSSKKKDKDQEKDKPVCKKQADREYVLDPSTGKWRSRRSMRENPNGKRPGRPKGSVKVPQHGKVASKSSPVSGSRDDTDESGPAGSSAHQSSSASARRPSAPSSSKQSVTSTNAKASTFKATDQEQLAASVREQKESIFRAPMPPQRGRQISSSRMVNFAQSSPVRPSMNASLMQADAVNAMPFFGSGTLASPSRDIRFRVPSYLMNSSPGTMLDTLMSEADFDFEELGPLGPLHTPGTLLGNLSRNIQQTPSSLRRSPRKNPHGTISGQNPYASPTSKRSTSPSLGRDLRMGRSLVDENGSPSRRAAAASSSNNNSPVTRSRTRSGHNVLHPALFSSSDDPSNNNDKSSSNVTSPSSPSEKVSTSKVARSKSKATSSLHSVGKSQLSSKKSQVEASARRSASADAEADDEDNGSEAQFVKGPYRKAGSTSREGSAGLPSCPASPSIGRATRKFTRNSSTASTQSLLQNGPAKLAQLDLPPSSPVFDHPTGRSSTSTIEVDGWGRTPSMREIFPTPSDLDWPSDASPGVSGSQSPVKLGKTETISTAEVESKELVKAAPEAQMAIVRRRPLPATVEDGSSSVSGSSPALSDDSPEASNDNLFDLLEDPYGILAASGFGIDADGALTSIEIPINQSSTTNNQMTPTSTHLQPAVTADNFNEIQLHQAKEFGTHLSDFNSSGGVGIAAHVAGSSGTAAAVQIANAPASSNIEGLNASFLANLPPELSNIFASPKKPIPPQIIELLASPRKQRARGATISPTKALQVATGEMVPSPQYNPGTEGQLNDEEQQDFSALFSNPDIQALLAEFEAST